MECRRLLAHFKFTRASLYISNIGPSSRAFSSISIQEENRSPCYDSKKYYPARIGERISGRYHLVSKLGWGANSTVWLAKDVNRWFWQSNKYVTLKITNSGKDGQRSAEEEVEISKRISQRSNNHEGRAYIRLVKDSFTIQGPRGEHVCLVFEPLREPLWLLGKHLGCVDVPPAVLKAFLRLLLQGLDFLHSEYHVIHTDLKSDNFLVGFEDSTVLENYVRQQESDPAPKGLGMVQISDFSAAVFGDVATPHNHDLQPRQFCVPEVLLKATWSYSADIWNLGTALWELLADATLFDGIDPTTNQYSRAAHLAQMIRLIGPPPLHVLEKSDEKMHFELFSSQGEFIHPHLIPSEEFNLSSRTPFLHGKDKRLFLSFARRMLQ
ncbi:hypothetical protein ASPWEDRAFT_60859 [Aspergillus wentii DTO 134E9]|uniref:non-specific serine/threonine protein kinase n=1 Tax=Aspergillus wentii DTO 134E9 TaxID=1073089 RepID=A0A1L9RHT4_ASPWE|nr:uncharacterized protein ASPWEDRAFT_60859 [Aspergillus wentii DTO 134E9]OJJ34492.1 hypothetical protein ASPWEDRAFT_60859 [Aspergillus wentii DTO 134E9]